MKNHKSIIISCIKAFLLQILLQKFPKFGTSKAVVDTKAPVQPSGLVSELKNVDWAMTGVAFCFTLAEVSLQIHSHEIPSNLLVVLFDYHIWVCFYAFEQIHKFQVPKYSTNP